MLFREDYLETRATAHSGWCQALQQLCLWVESGTPCCYLRYGDGEFNCVCGFERKWPREKEAFVEHASFIDTLSPVLGQILFEIAQCHPNHGNLLFGGYWQAHPAHEAFVREHDLLRRLPWVPCQLMVTGLMSMYTMRLLKAIIEAPGPRALVVHEGVKEACRGLDATWIEIPKRDCWLEKDRITKDIANFVQPGAILLYAGGLGIKPVIWKVWRHFPFATHIDMGHFLDPAFGLATRRWLTGDGARKRCFLEHYAPVILGERGPPEDLVLPVLTFDSPCDLAVQ